MTVAELMELLKGHAPDTPVRVIVADEFGPCSHAVDICGITRVTDCECTSGPYIEIAASL